MRLTRHVGDDVRLWIHWCSTNIRDCLRGPLQRALVIDHYSFLIGRNVTRLVGAGWVVASSFTASAWEGHEWSQWREVTTWTSPVGNTDQTGRRDLTPLLGGEPGTTNQAETLKQWQPRRAEYAEIIQAILGSPGKLEKPAVEIRDLGTEQLAGYRRRHLQIRSEAEDWIPAYLLVPDRLAAARVPAMLCLHQTVPQGKEEACGIQGDPELAFAVELVKRGYVCLAPDALGFGERIPAGKQPYHDSAADRLSSKTDNL